MFRQLNAEMDQCMDSIKHSVSLNFPQLNKEKIEGLLVRDKGRRVKLSTMWKSSLEY